MKKWLEDHSTQVLFTALGLLLIFCASVAFFGEKYLPKQPQASKFEALPLQKQE